MSLPGLDFKFETSPLLEFEFLIYHVLVVSGGAELEQKNVSIT